MLFFSHLFKNGGCIVISRVFLKKKILKYFPLYNFAPFLKFLLFLIMDLNLHFVK